ncbi:serine/threonine protein kinase HT1, putative [Entamoeba invadens IP1]|uniref:Serine/threonine protein kinase HT1, putative n=1 Tax=Entamoeba invadens IP1 TaxID=370355 RepID=A0A0A1TVZ4_ENTIV|nr:serine/threonine protein kinase HT1, putative [Entamoeba invadens IP1]ELP83453.1 serine/threonine protein kinase HT1, putative [Entamoeba invadens IP1]|eukprot:XP_004182799.1 serine/threonine protein kinase HT1, putative [Entamoeba invadens IP1]
MDNKNSEEIEVKIRIKFMMDASKGIQYLHNNGILHRDIKPDNLLIFGIDINEMVNAKLTDFGSSRNVNLLMTNMTFTKGVGSPVYMAPEVLKQEKYQKSADIYSFAITMFECFGWCEAYPLDTFKYPWKIAEFVNSGKRIEKGNKMSPELFGIIQKCWKQSQHERITIEEVENALQLVSII